MYSPETFCWYNPLEGIHGSHFMQGHPRLSEEDGIDSMAPGFSVIFSAPGSESPAGRVPERNFNRSSSGFPMQRSILCNPHVSGFVDSYRRAVNTGRGTIADTIASAVGLVLCIRSKYSSHDVLEGFAEESFKTFHSGRPSSTSEYTRTGECSPLPRLQLDPHFWCTGESQRQCHSAADPPPVDWKNALSLVSAKCHSPRQDKLWTARLFLQKRPLKIQELRLERLSMNDPNRLRTPLRRGRSKRFFHPLEDRGHRQKQVQPLPFGKTCVASYVWCKVIGQASTVLITLQLENQNLRSNACDEICELLPNKVLENIYLPELSLTLLHRMS
eukprot:753295-Hanusia_phi.AAC.8